MQEPVPWKTLPQEGRGNGQYELPASQAKLQIGIIDPLISRILKLQES